VGSPSEQTIDVPETFSLGGTSEQTTCHVTDASETFSLEGLELVPTSSTLSTPFSFPVQITRLVIPLLVQFPFRRGKQDTQGRPERAQTQRLQTAFFPLQVQHGAMHPATEQSISQRPRTINKNRKQLKSLVSHQAQTIQVGDGLLLLLLL